MYLSAIFLCSAWIDKFTLRHPLLHVDGGYPASSIARFTENPRRQGVEEMLCLK
jgi:hypothetical protein